jgi:hypothetical protein
MPKRQQTIAKRDRERALEERRRLKRERKHAEREASRTGEAPPPSGPTDGNQPASSADWIN